MCMEGGGGREGGGLYTKHRVGRLECSFVCYSVCHTFPSLFILSVAGSITDLHYFCPVLVTAGKNWVRETVNQTVVQLQVGKLCLP